MKFILRPKSLQEAIPPDTRKFRQSVDIYYKIGQFFIDKVVLPQNLITNKISSTDQVVFPRGSESISVPVPTLIVNLDPNLVKSLPYSEYVAYTSDDGSQTKGKPIIWEYSYNKIFSQLSFHIVPYINDATAGMSSDGTYVLYKNDWVIDRDLLVGQKNIPREQLVKGMPSPDGAMRLILEQIKTKSVVFAHEITHLANLLRSGGIAYRAKGGDKQFQVGSKEYVDSTEELHAFQIESETYLRNTLKETDIKKIYETYASDFIYFLALRNKIKFMRAFFWAVVVDRFGIQAWNNMKTETKRRLVKSLDVMYDRHAGSKEPAVRKMVKYLASTGNRPEYPPRKYPAIPL
jgi:hypothetical protein